MQLIEKLESACIRFVHFSKENELRSRVSTGMCYLSFVFSPHSIVARGLVCFLVALHPGNVSQGHSFSEIVHAATLR